MEDKLIIVSGDSHAGMPNELWTQYLDKRFHDLLPQLREDNVIYPLSIELQTVKLGLSSHPEHAEAHSRDWHGLYDPVLRLADMDREGIAAELVYLGDSRLGDLFHNVSNRKYSTEAWEAGSRAWNRWAADTFGFAMDRFLMTAAIGPCVDMDVAVKEIDWVAERNFTGTFLPGMCITRGCRRSTTRTGSRSGPRVKPTTSRWSSTPATAPNTHRLPTVERMYRDVEKAAGTTDRDALLAHADAITDESLEFFVTFLNHSVHARRPMWQLMLGGVFDRHPNLKLFPTEIRVDWIPPTLAHLDRVAREHPELPCKKLPSEYWRSNCLGGASFLHKSEVEIRHEIGIETFIFGRDYPHPESTWPHTREWLRDCMAGVPDEDVRLMLGENANPLLWSGPCPPRGYRAPDRSHHRGDPQWGCGAPGSHRQLRAARWLPQARRG